MNRSAVRFLFLLALIVPVFTRADEVPLKFTRLDLTDGRKLKNVVVKSYDAKTERLLLIADGKAMMVPIGVVPAPFNEQLKAAPAAGGSVNTVAAPPRPIAPAVDQYYMERAVPVPPQIVYVPRPAAPAARSHPVDPMLAEVSLKGHQNAARARAERFYRFEHQMGSNSITVTSYTFELTVPVAVPGWEGRYRTDGKAYIEFYDSKGRSFQRTTSTFEVTTEQKPGAALEVVDFSRKS